MNRRVLILGLTVVVLLVGAVIVVSTVFVSPRPEVPTLNVTSGPFRVRVTAEGNLAAVRNTPLTAPMKPQMPFTLAWIIDDGAMIEENQIIARFDASQLEQDREDGLSDRKINDQHLTSAVTSREVNVDKLDRDVEVAGEELEVAREFQQTDTQIYSKIEIVEDQIDTELAETRADHARKSQGIQDSLSEAEIELLAIERRKAEIKIQQADEGLAALDVRSPHAGIVMLERDWRGNPVRVGDTVWPGRPLARIPDLSEMQAEVFVLEADAGDLEEGQSATVWLDADPDVAHTATLESIDPMAGRRNRRVPVQYFRTVLSLEHTDTETMKPGARVHAEITIADFDAVVTIPRQSVCNLDGRPVVYRWVRGEFTATDVELGPAAFGRVVVSSGLNEGDLIALRDPTRADDEGATGLSPSAPILPGGGS